MMRGLRRHRRDIAALVLLIAVSLGVLTYILFQQPAFHPPSALRTENRDPYLISAEFTAAPGVIAGQGQTIDIAGVPVGEVRSVGLREGHAVIGFRIRRKYAPVYRDASILIRPKTALKDLYLALDPGTEGAGMIPQNGNIPLAQTQPDVNADEIFANLDADTRDYLNLLLGGAAQALRDRAGAPAGDGRPSDRAVADLRGTYKRFEPLAADGRKLTEALGRRRANLRRAIHSFQLISTRIGRVEGDLSQLVDVSDRTFGAFAAQDSNLRAALGEFPGALRQTDVAVTGLTRFGRRLTPTLRELVPFARALGPSLAATRPFFSKTTPVLRDQLRPFARGAAPVIAQLRPAAKVVRQSTPPLQRTLHVINRLFNALAYNPPGREEGYLFWGSWLSHIGPSLATAQDAHGATPRAVLLTTCAQLEAIHAVELGNPSLGPILRLINLPDRVKICGATDTPSGPTGTRGVAER